MMCAVDGVRATKSDLLTAPNRGTTTTSDNVCQELVRSSLLRVMFDSVVKMFEFLVSDSSQVLEKIGQFLANFFASLFHVLHPSQKFPHLCVVMLSNLGLDGFSASHGSLLAQNGGRPAQSSGSYGPDWIHGSWTDAMLGYDFVEVLEVACLLVVHVLHQWTKMRVGSDRRRSLSLVDEDSSEFSSLIDSELEAVRLGINHY